MPALILTFAVLAHIVLPLGYAALCLWMYFRGVWWFTYLAWLFVFGAFGGWCLSLEVASLGAVPLTVILTLSTELFLLTVAAGACLASSLVLQFRKQKNRFDRAAMLGGYAFLVTHGAYFVTVVFLSWWSPK